MEMRHDKNQWPVYETFHASMLLQPLLLQLLL
jgi:hypothetical protein